MMTRQRIMGDVLLNGMERVVKARRDKYGATGHAHINTVSFLSHCTIIIHIFPVL